jgi:hypothetical protein
VLGLVLMGFEAALAFLIPKFGAQFYQEWGDDGDTRHAAECCDNRGRHHDAAEDTDFANAGAEDGHAFQTTSTTQFSGCGTRSFTQASMAGSSRCLTAARWRMASAVLAASANAPGGRFWRT